MQQQRQTLRQLWSSHPRLWREFHYVYPVISRRAHGLSIGVNLNPDKACNWGCVYCQVDRTTAPLRRDVDLDQLRAELDWMLGYAASGAVWDEDPFTNVPPALQRINDIAFSGDGEPTTYRHFDFAVELAAVLKAAHHLADVKIIVLSNMTVTGRDAVRRGFELLDQNNGEVWAKLDAGTQNYYENIDRGRVPLEKTLANILDTGRRRPLVIQTLLMRLDGQPMPDAEFNAWLDRIGELLTGGCGIKLVQLYTIARQTAEAFATPLSDTELESFAHRFRTRFPRVPVESFPGVG